MASKTLRHHRPESYLRMSPYTILGALHEAGYTWQEDRTWCDTGKAIRVCKSGPVARHRSRCDGKKNLIERAYTLAERSVIARLDTR